MGRVAVISPNIQLISCYLIGLIFCGMAQIDKLIYLSIYLSIYLYIYIYIYICIFIETILSSLQACSVITHSSGDFIRRIKSPDELVITKQACRDESIVSLFFSPVAIYIYIYICERIKKDASILCYSDNCNGPL